MSPFRVGLRQDLILLLVLFGLLYFGMSWTRPLSNPDEGRYVEIPREMLESGDWVAPRLNGVLYFYKPPLFYWLEAGAMQLGGGSLFALRFWPAAIALLGIVGTYLAARRMFGRPTGLASAVVLGTSLLYFGLSQIIILDMAVSVFMALGLFLFYLALHEEGPARKWLFWGFYLSIALAVMVKGFMGLLVPGAVIFLWFLLLNQWTRLRRLYLISGGLLFLIVTLPWHIAAHMSSPHWFDFYVIHEHFERYLSDVSDRNQPFWFFFVIMPVAIFPWTLFLPQALLSGFRHGWQQRREHSAMWYLGLTALFILLFFSISKSKLIPYILPGIPALAVIVGHYMVQLWQDPAKHRLKAILWAFSGLAAALAIAMPIIAVSRSGKLGPNAGLVFMIVMAWLLAAAVCMAVVLRKGQLRQGLAVLFAGIYGFLFLFNPLAATVQRPSTKPFADVLNQHLQPEDEIYTFQDYYQDLPYYLGRSIGVAENVPNEQHYGIEWEPEHASRYPRQQEVAARWNEPVRIFGLAKPDHAAQFADQVRIADTGRVYLWMATKDFELFANVPPPGDTPPKIIEYNHE